MMKGNFGLKRGNLVDESPQDLDDQGFDIVVVPGCLVGDHEVQQDVLNRNEELETEIKKSEQKLCLYIKQYTELVLRYRRLTLAMEVLKESTTEEVRLKTKISELTKIVKQQKTQVTDLQICVSSLEEEYGEEAKKQFFCICNNTLDSVIANILEHLGGNWSVISWHNKQY